MKTLQRVGVNSIKELKQQDWFIQEANRISDKYNLGTLLGYYMDKTNTPDEGNLPVILVGGFGIVSCNFTKNNDGEFKLLPDIPVTLEKF